MRAKYDEADDEWYHTDPKDRRFSKDIVQALKENHGDRAHLYALERLLEGEQRKDELSIELWRDILDKLTEEKDNEST
jgi:hypothetical protein